MYSNTSLYFFRTTVERHYTHIHSPATLIGTGLFVHVVCEKLKANKKPLTEITFMFNVNINISSSPVSECGCYVIG